MDIFQEVQKDLHKEGGAKNMCEVLDRIVNEGKIEGKIEAYYDDDRSVEEIAQKMGMSVEDVETVIKSLGLEK